MFDFLKYFWHSEEEEMKRLNEKVELALDEIDEAELDDFADEYLE